MAQVAAPARVRIREEELYQLDKYQVHLGLGTAGFCTVWNEPKAVLQLAPQLLEKAAIVGTLYSSYGVNVIIRNLALNPFIRTIYVWSYGPLSNTKFGVIGTSVLKRLWENGVADDGTVPGTSFKLEKEIDRGVFDRIRANVELIDVSEHPLEGTSADFLALELAKHELMSQTAHALDIGIQLARAEIALKKGLEFTQDRPLPAF